MPGFRSRADGEEGDAVLSFMMVGRKWFIISDDQGTGVPLQTQKGLCYRPAPVIFLRLPPARTELSAAEGSAERRMVPSSSLA